MSSAPPKTPPSAEPAFDLDYSIHDFEVDPNPDSQFLYQRIDEAALAEGLTPGGRTLDVACGVGALAVQVCERGGEGWGIDSSQEMLGLNRWVFPARRLPLVRGVAEALPFRDGSFDRIVCKGSLDHFVDPQAFMRDAARLLRPGGRIVVALANYESLSCRLGRLWRRVETGVLCRPIPPHRAYFEPPPDHYHKGDLAFVRALGGRRLELERWYGLSLLWLLRDSRDWRWGDVLAGLSPSLARALLLGLDRIACRLPAQADMIVSVWRLSGEGDR